MILGALLALIALALSIATPAWILRRSSARRRRWVVCLSGALGALAGLALAGEIQLRRLGEKPYQRSFPGQFEDTPDGVYWAELDAELGWTGPRASPGTNPQGFRDPRDFAALAPEPAKKRVLVLGDSFVAGSGVGADETVPALLEAELGPGWECFNLGVPGWGIDQMALAHRRYAPLLRPDWVVLAFIDDDVRRVIEAHRFYEHMEKPCFEVRDGRLQPQDAPSRIERACNELGRRSVLFGFLFRHACVWSEGRAVVAEFLAEIGRDARANGRRLLVMRIPTRDELLPRARVRRWVTSCESAANAAGAMYLDPGAAIAAEADWTERLYIADGHMSAAGNAYLARNLAARLRAGSKPE